MATSFLEKIDRNKFQMDYLVYGEKEGELEKAINLGGTTIHTYTSVDGITGRFQQELLVHNKKSLPCPNCKTEIVKIVVNGRGTYYCPKCQK